MLDEIAPTAAAAGAVNTIALRDGRWVGMNTDADGFIEPLRARACRRCAENLRAVILGAGGAARGVGLALRREGRTGHDLRARREQAAGPSRARSARAPAIVAAAIRLVGPARQRDAPRQPGESRACPATCRSTAGSSTTWYTTPTRPPLICSGA